MENETVDYGKVTGMVHSTEVWCSRRAWDPLYCLPSRLSNAVSILPQSRYLGNGNQQVP